MGEYDNNSISSNEIDLQTEQDLEDFEDDNMQFKFREGKIPVVATHLLLPVPTQKQPPLYFLVVHVVLSTN